MVSRGGRSKGCSNCRRRRVKCDETRPACIRCQKRGLPCDGPKEHTFVNHTQDRPRVPPEDCSDVIRFSSPSPQLCLTAFYDNICLEYTRKLILNGGPAQLACDLAYSRRSRLEDDPGMRLLQDAINSLAVTFFGRQHHQKAIETKGYQRYGKVLARLNHHLSTTELQTSDWTIMSAFICVLVESFIPTGPLGFLAHLRGLEAILEARGVPKAPVPRDTLVILHGLRTLSIVGGLVMARSCLFSRPEWRAMPCTTEDDDEDGILRCKVLDILADCTRFMGEGAKLLFTDPSPLESRLQLGSEVKAALAQLGPLHAQWMRYNQEQLQHASTEAAKHTNIANLQTATTYMYCNLAYILLLDILQVLDPASIRESATNAEFVSEVGDYPHLRKTAALNIIRCLQHRIHAREETVGEADTIAFLATKISWQALGGFKTSEGRGLLHVVQQANGDLCTAGAFKEPTVELGSPCQMLWERYPDWQKTPIISTKDGDRWPLLSEYGPTTVLGDAFASSFKSWLGKVQERGYI